MECATSVLGAKLSKANVLYSAVNVVSEDAELLNQLSQLSMANVGCMAEG